MGHESRSCTNLVCFNCGGVGHISAKCKEKRKKRIDFGTFMRSLVSNISAKDLKLTRCLRCFNYGHIHCSANETSSRAAIYCYRCAREGHSGSKCPYYGHASQGRAQAYNRPPIIGNYSRGMQRGRSGAGREDSRRKRKSRGGKSSNERRRQRRKVEW